MNADNRLRLVKTTHTAIWIFSNVLIFYMLHAAITGKLNMWLWIGFALVFTEGIVLLIFKLVCPLTLIARRYSTSDKDNFDIYLPEWLAKYTKLIYTTLVAVIIVIVVIRLLNTT